MVFIKMNDLDCQAKKRIYSYVVFLVDEGAELDMLGGHRGGHGGF